MNISSTFDSPKNSVSSKGYAFLQTQAAGYEFTVEDLMRSLSIVRPGPVGGFVHTAIEKGMCERKEFVQHPGRRKQLLFRLVDPTVEIEVKNSSPGGAPGRRNPHFNSKLPTRALGSLSDRLLELAAEVQLLEGPVNLQNVPIEELLAEVQRRIPIKQKRG